MPYKLLVEPQAILDIQKAVDFYDEQQAGLGEKFKFALDNHLLSIQKNPFFQVRYDEVHCLPMKKFPYMIHFTVNQETQSIIVRAVFHTSLNPAHWTKRKT